MKPVPFRATAVAFALPLALSSAALAQTERDLGSHEHGAATLDVVIDGSSLLLELGSPWANLVGFEHEPSTDEQRAALDDALATLGRPDELFVPSGGDCTASAPLVSTALGDDGHHDDEHDENHDDEHAGEHAGEHDDEHDDEHDEDHGDEHDETHSELAASYAFECADIDSLSAIDLPLLSIWSGIEELDVQLAGPGGQSAAELGGDDRTLDLAGIR